MAEYIKREEAIDRLTKMSAAHRRDEFGGQLLHYTGIKAMLESITSADVKPVVLCKDCRFLWKEDGWDNLWCNRLSGSFQVEKDSYCSFGRKDDV